LIAIKLLCFKLTIPSKLKKKEKKKEGEPNRSASVHLALSSPTLVGKCYCNYFLKYFLFKNKLKNYFFIFKKLFLISTHQSENTKKILI